MLTGLAFAAALMVQPAAAAGIQSVDVRGDRVTVRFDDAVGEARVFALAGPDRIAIDIDGAEPGARANISGSVRAVRQGRPTPETARVVLDLDRPLSVTGASFSPDGKSFTVTMTGASAGEWQRAVGALSRRIASPVAAATARKGDYVVTVPLGKPRKAAGLPAIQGPDDARLPLVVIDAGHGGHDPGALNTAEGKREKDITLAIAKKLRDELVRGGRVRVALTRDSDRFIVLQDRYTIARKLKADLFISIHADAAENAQATGSTVYTLSEVASDREAQRLAARENKADIINGVNLGGTEPDVSTILIDLAQRETMNVSSDFARTLIRTSGTTLQMKTQPHRFASLIVLKAPDTPSVLFESGYISNADDVKRISSPVGQQQIARGLAGAIRLHFARRLAAR